MNADDPRHGTYAGYVAGCRLICCRAGAMRYRKRLRLDVIAGLDRMVPSAGSLRRLEGLMVEGWSLSAIAEHIERMHKPNLSELMRSSRPLIRSGVADRIRTACDLLVEMEPAGRAASVGRIRNLAAARGYVPLGAWLNIDDPDEIPDPGYSETRGRYEPADEVVVERILGGDWTLKATPAERWEVINRWPESDQKLEKRTGWNIARDRREMASQETREDGAA